MALDLTPGQIINANFIDFSTILHYTYNQMFGGPKNWAKALSFPLKTDQDEVSLPFLESKIGLALGQRGVPVKRRTALGGQGTVRVEKFEDGMEFDAHDLSQDRTGMLKQKATEIGEGAAFFGRDQIVDILRNGTTPTYTLFDGVPVFDNAHPRGGTSFDNISTGVLNPVNFAALRTQMVTFPSDAGVSRPLGRGAAPSHLFIPSALFETASEIMNNNFVAGANGEADNILKGAATIIEVEELTDTNDWYLIKGDFIIKPFFHIFKKNHSPIKVFMKGTSPSDVEHEQEVVAFIGWTYERLFPTRPELFIKSVN